MPRPRAHSLWTAPVRGIKALAEAIFNTPNAWGVLTGGGAQIERKVGDGGANSIIVSTLGWLQRNFIQAPPRIRVPGEDGSSLTPVTSAGALRMLDLLEDPNPFYDWGALAKASILSEVLAGEFFWQIVRNGQGAPIQLWWVPHTLIEPKRAEGSREFITHYEYQPGTGQAVRLELEDVIHHRNGLDPNNPMRGMSRVKSVLREVYTDEEAATYTSTLLVNMGVPGIVVSPDSAQPGMGMPSPDDVAETKAKFEQMTTGSNRGRAIVMRGPTNLQTVGFSPEQMNLRELRRIPEERITAAIGVPAVVVGLGAGLDRSTFANMHEAREAAAEEALVPLWHDVARTLKKQLLPQFEGSRATQMVVDFDTANVRVLQEDADKKVDRALRLLAGGAGKVSEAREAAGLPVDETHDLYLRSLTMLEVPGTPTPLEEEVAQTDRTLEYRMTALVNAGMITPNMALERLGFPPQPGGDVLRTTEVAGDDGGAKGLKAKRQLPRAAQARLIQKLQRDQRQLERGFAQRLEKTFTALGTHVAKAWAAETKGKALEPGDTAAVQRTLKRANLTSWRKTNFDNTYEQHYRGVVDTSVETVTATLGIDIGGVDKIAVEVLQEGGTRAGLVDLEAQTKDAMLAAIADAREAGLGPVEIERKIREYTTNGGPTANVNARAMRIARTETLHAQRVSTRRSYAETFSTLIAWDDRIGHGDDECSARNGTEFSFEDAEAEEATTHPNCTLSWAPGTVRE